MNFMRAIELAKRRNVKIYFDGALTVDYSSGDTSIIDGRDGLQPGFIQADGGMLKLNREELDSDKWSTEETNVDKEVLAITWPQFFNFFEALNMRQNLGEHLIWQLWEELKAIVDEKNL